MTIERAYIVIILLLAPFSKIPGKENIFLFRPVDIFLITTGFFFLSTKKFLGRHDIQIIGVMLIFFFVSIASVIWGNIYLGNQSIDSLSLHQGLVEYYPFALGKLVLILLCFFGFIFIISSSGITNRGLLLFSCYALLICIILHIACYLSVDDYFLQRAGVFIEGNHGGSYYLMSFFMMWYASNNGWHFGRVGMLAALFGLLLSQSTASLTLFIGLIFFTFLSLPANTRKKLIGMHGLVLWLATLIIITFLFGEEIITKFLGEETGALTFSRLDRLSSIASGLNMFFDHPIFGVGIQGYAFALPNYIDPFLQENFDWSFRRIPNNIYIEILSEEGVIGIIAMALLLYSVCKKSFSNYRENAIICFGLLSILGSWLAFPTYTVSFHWIGFAIFYRLSAGKKCKDEFSANMIEYQNAGKMPHK